ncbi:hypothetical protein FOL47_006508 [Perkinsus chesapeaki]|uniref:Uncharacterized protein n=1 Tax=Perkinsus chesapeaki TaxID=330153 RepID=A0A7J6LRW1_PERCH|nr:hypothetical protein FOL47_006508 [Perkinsus chesapeaki]
MSSLTTVFVGCILAVSSSRALADHADDVVTLLNKRFNEGGPTSDLSKAGVLMHQWDGLGAEDYDQSWRPYTPEECSNSSSHANCQYSDRISCLLINNDVRNPGDGRIPLYTYTRGGTVEDPDFTEVTCAYSEDGGTMDRSNAGCGCHSGDDQCEAWGDNNSCALEGPVADLSVCWWGPNDLQNMMENQKGVYNEVVISSATYLKNLPESIQAFFFIANNSLSETETRTQYGTFKASYPDSDVPLLVINYDAKESPFFKADNTQMYTTAAPTTSNNLTTTPSYGTTQSGQYPGSSITTSPQDSDGQAGSTSNAYGKSTTLGSFICGLLLLLSL